MFFFYILLHWQRTNERLAFLETIANNILTLNQLVQTYATILKLSERLSCLAIKSPTQLM